MPRAPQLLALALAVSGCGGAADPVADPAACPQTYEFGNTGCADLAGVVRDRAGRPVAGAYVSTSAADARRVVLVAGPARTDTAGRYLLRLTRVLVSWNFRHIVRLDKIRLFDAVSVEQGYRPVAIRSPREVTTYGRDPDDPGPGA